MKQNGAGAFAAKQNRTSPESPRAVYNTSGGLLGSWTSGSLQSNAQVEGVATNGTDVWLVDNKTDKVFKYTGAASRLSGSQNAASSFSLAAGNTSPKDIVTDGASLWVVNDSTTDKVFQYTASASRNSGSQIADISFALAVGNSNPQGIADPPTPRAGAAIQQAPGRASRATEPMRVIAVDDFLRSELDQHAGRRTESLADSFLDALIGLDQWRAKIRTLKHSVR